MNKSVVIVTGGGRGIGRAICQRFASAGAQVIAASRSVKELEETRRLIVDGDGACEIQPTDVASPDDVSALIHKTREQFGRVDVLVNNAGVAPHASLEELDPEVFDAIWSVNVRAVYSATRAVWPVMCEQRGGTIINISSVAAVDPFPGFAAYGASKAWVSAWTKAVAEEGKPVGIRVFAVGPGAVETRMLRDVFPEFPADQALEPADVADVAFELAQQSCRYVNGQTIFIKR